MWGERAFAALFGALGVAWIVQSLKLRYWDNFAPGSGFFPFWLGVVLVALVVLYLVLSFRPKIGPVKYAAPQPPARIGRMAAIIGGLVVTVAILETAGFVLAIGLYLAFLLGVVERRTLVVTAGVTFGATLALHLIFRSWLGVPLPEGPWGF
jgi:hypothetical protein